jgi:hypothetical protein
MKSIPAFLVAGVLAGCALPPVVENGPDAAIAQALEASRLPPSEQARAVQQAQERFVRHPDASSRLQLATLLATLPAPLRDDARAIELLQPLARPGGTRSERYAAFLTGQLAQRQRLSREAERLGKEVERLGKEVERLAREREKAEREHAAADRERDKREEAMRQQIEALRSIERGILEREERMRRRPR